MNAARQRAKDIAAAETLVRAAQEEVLLSRGAAPAVTTLNDALAALAVAEAVPLEYTCLTCGTDYDPEAAASDPLGPGHAVIGTATLFIHRVTNPVSLEIGNENVMSYGICPDCLTPELEARLTEI